MKKLLAAVLCLDALGDFKLCPRFLATTKGDRMGRGREIKVKGRELKRGKIKRRGEREPYGGFCFHQLRG